MVLKILFRYFSFIFCVLILIGLEACSSRVVEESPLIPAAHEKTVTADQKAYQAMTRGDYKTGIRLYEQISAKDPKNPMACYYLGYAYGQTGDRFREVLLYEKAISLGYKTDQIFHNLGEAYLGLGQIEKSVQAFELLQQMVRPTSTGIRNPSENRALQDFDLTVRGREDQQCIGRDD